MNMNMSWAPKPKQRVDLCVRTLAMPSPIPLVEPVTRASRPAAAIPK